MKALIINKDLNSERWRFQQAQCRSLALDFERVAAVLFENLSPDRNDDFWLTWERHLIDAEKSAFCSHRNAWRRVLENGANTLILEDDAVLSKNLSVFLRQFEDDNSFDHITLETRGRLKLIGKTINSGICRLYLDRCGAAAYILSPKGASKLLDQYMNETALADAAIALAHNLKSYRQCIEILEINKQSASIFYSLSYLDWYQEIIQALLNEKNQNIIVNWKVVNNNSMKCRNLQHSQHLKLQNRDNFDSSQDQSNRLNIVFQKKT